MRNIIRNKAGVLYIWVSAFTLIALYCLIWYFLNAVIQAMALTVMTAYPAYFNNAFMMFLLNVWTFSPAIMIFLGVIVFVVVEGHKEKSKNYVYV